MKTLNKSVLAFAIALSSIGVQAQSFFPMSSTELQTALTASAGNTEADTITLVAMTYNGPFSIPKMENTAGKLTIIGQGEGKTILAGDNSSIVVNLVNNYDDYVAGIDQVEIAISELSVTGGYGTDAANVHSGALNFYAANKLTLTSVEISNNVGYYGAVSARNIIATDVNVHDNTGYNTNAWGAGLHSWFSVDVTNSEFTNNTNTWAGSAIANSSVNGSTIVVDSTFTGNTTYKFGGAINSMGNVVSTITGSTFTNNSASDGLGGAIRFVDEGAITITDSTFTNNSVNGSVREYCSEDQLERNFCVGDGGAIFIDDYYAPTITIEGSEFTDNSAWGTGGAVAVDGTCSQGYPKNEPGYEDAVAECIGQTDQTNIISYVVSDSIFTDNTAGYRGQAIWTSEGPSKPNTYTYGEITFTNSRFINNDVDSVSGFNSVVVEIVEREEDEASPVTQPEDDVVPPTSETSTPAASAGGGSGGGSMSFLILIGLALLGLTRRVNESQFPLDSELLKLADNDGWTVNDVMNNYK